MTEKTRQDDPQLVRELQIQVPPEVARGAYANQMLVAHTQEEFVLDFILATPPAGIVNARVIISPTHAKRIATAITENIAKYEAQFGKIVAVAPQMPENVTAH